MSKSNVCYHHLADIRIAPAQVSNSISPQGNDDQQNTNHCDAAPIIDPLHLADHEAAGGPIYVPQTLPGEENSCRANNEANKQQRRVHFICPLIRSLV
jgi:hypothetical protein